MERRVAKRYRECRKKYTGSVPVGLGDLERLIRVGKLWSMVEFIASARQAPDVYPEETVAYIVRELPEFVEGL